MYTFCWGAWVTNMNSGGHGNGTTHPLSIDDNLYRKMLEIFGFQSQIRDMVRSMHGVFTCRLEKNDDAPSSLRM